MAIEDMRDLCLSLRQDFNSCRANVIFGGNVTFLMAGITFLTAGQLFDQMIRKSKTVMQLKKNFVFATNNVTFFQKWYICYGFLTQ